MCARRPGECRLTGQPPGRTARTRRSSCVERRPDSCSTPARSEAPNLVHFARYVMPPLAWAGFIFFLSSRPSSAYEGMADAAPPIPGLSYLLHGLLYLVLAALLLRWLLSSERRPFASARMRTGVFVIAVACIYGLSDGVHQAFVPDRAFEALDLLADTAGAAAAVAIWAA